MKSLIANTIKILLFVLFFNLIVFPQQDTISVSDTAQVNSEFFEMQKSPWGAVARSAIIPGWGQIYNESYWKAPLIWGIMGWFVYAWIDNNNQYQDYKLLYEQSPEDIYLRYRDFYRDQRDEFAIYLLLTYFLNLVDAYVDAHLFDFNVNENYITGSKMFNVRFKF